MHTIERIAPSYWAPYLINHDASDLEPSDLALITDWINRWGHGFPVSCEDYGFTWSHDAQYDIGACDCQIYTFLTIL